MAVKGSTKKTNRSAAKAQIIRRRLRGETTRQIAAAVGVAQNTVIRILSLPEVREALARTRTILMVRADELAQRLIQIALGKTKKGDRQALVDILRGLGVLTPTAKIELSQFEVEGERDYSDAIELFFRLHHRMPTTMEEVIKFDKTIPVEPLAKKLPPD